MRRNEFGRLASAAMVVVALVGCTSSTDDPTPAPSTVTVPEDVELEAVCGTVDPALVERLLPAAEPDEGITTGEGFASVRCAWANDASQEPSGTLEAVSESGAVAEGAGPEELAESACAGVDVTQDGPGELSCASSTGGQVDLVAVEGSVVVRVTFVRTGEDEVSPDQEADLDQLVSGLLTAMPER